MTARTLVIAATGIMAICWACSERVNLLQDVAEVSPKAATVLLGKYRASSRKCASENLSRDGAALLTALEIAESFARPTFIQELERLIFLFSKAMLNQPYDISYGPMQIKFHNFEKFKQLPASSVFDSCASRQAARKMLEKLLGVSLDGVQTLTREHVLRSARLFNGQTVVRKNQSTAKVLASARYNELVYNLFQEARFSEGGNNS